MTVSGATDHQALRTWGDVIARHAARLAAAGVATPEVDAGLLARHVTGRSPASLRAEPADDEGLLARLDALVARRAERIPLQHVTGETFFRLLRLSCPPDVFIPRPETEVVAGFAIDAARTAGPRPVVVEVGTGTGAIALSIVAEVPGAQVVATDVDPAAVAAARANLAALERGDADVPGPAAGTSCTVRQGDLLAPVADLRGTVDVLVSNPPYLPAADRTTWAPEVADHDPDRALVGGDDGHEVVDALIASAPGWLRPGGTLVCEIDERRGGDARARATAAGLHARVAADLTGADRVLIARLPEEDHL